MNTTKNSKAQKREEIIKRLRASDPSCKYAYLEQDIDRFLELREMAESDSKQSPQTDPIQL